VFIQDLEAVLGEEEKNVHEGVVHVRLAFADELFHVADFFRLELGSHLCLHPVSEIVESFSVIAVDFFVFVVGLPERVVVSHAFFYVDAESDRLGDLNKTLEAERAVSGVVVAVTDSSAFSFLSSLSVDFALADRSSELRIVAVVFVDPAAERILFTALALTLRLGSFFNSNSSDVVMSSVAVADFVERNGVAVVEVHGEIFVVDGDDVTVILLEESGEFVAEVLMVVEDVFHIVGPLKEVDLFYMSNIGFSQQFVNGKS